jgi:type II secretory pathway pseudopilin PulG
VVLRGGLSILHSKKLCENAAMLRSGGRRPAVTLIETLVAGLVLALVLWLLAGFYARGLDTARVRQARVLLRTLDDALAAYYDEAQAYPPGLPNGVPNEALNTLLQVPASADVLATLDLRLLHMRDGRPECLDPWGRRLRYASPRIGDMDLRKRVERNGGEPIFECAGPDGRFGHAGDRYSADDVASDEPRT